MFKHIDLNFDFIFLSMDREKYEKFLTGLIVELETYRARRMLKGEEGNRLYNSRLEAKLEQVVIDVGKILPDYSFYFNDYWRKIRYSRMDGQLRTTLFTSHCISFCKEILAYIEDEKRTKEKIEGNKIFEGAKDKLSTSATAFRNEDWNSVMNNLNTCVELALKDKLGIPTTLSTINTNKIIEVLIKHEVEPLQYLKEVKKHLFLDNKIKHQGYVANKIDCINAMKAVEELIHKMEKTNISVNEDVMRKIYGSV